MTRRPPKPARSRARTHQLIRDAGVPGHCTCGLPACHVSHQLPAVDPATTEAEQRRLGDREPT